MSGSFAGYAAKIDRGSAETGREDRTRMNQTRGRTRTTRKGDSRGDRERGERKNAYKARER